MKTDFINSIKKPITMNPDDTLHQHDIDIQEIKARLNSLENIVNRIQQNKPPYWV